MKKRETVFALAAAAIAILSLIISAVVLKDISDRQAEIGARIQRLSKVQDDMISVLFVANDELNYSNLYLTLHQVHRDNPRANVLLQGAGEHYYKSFLTNIVNTYDEDKAGDLENLKTLELQLRRLQPRFSEDFPAAIKEGKDVLSRITFERGMTQARIMTERNDLLAEREKLARRESRVEFLATSIQFLSILLVLIKDVFKPKGQTTPAD